MRDAPTPPVWRVSRESMSVEAPRAGGASTPRIVARGESHRVYLSLPMLAERFRLIPAEPVDSGLRRHHTMTTRDKTTARTS
jgi:hypothetical protein